MRPSTLAVFSIPLFLTTLTTAIDCDHIRVDNKKFSLSKIGGPHSVLVHDESRPPSVYNTTWTVDICQALKKDKKVPDGDQCPSYTQVCGVVKSWNPIDDPDQEHVQTENVIPVAGEFKLSHGGSLDAKFSRLKATDANTEGLQLEMHGGTYGNKKQEAVIQFQCDKTRTGNEPIDEAEKMEKREGEDEEDDVNSLTFVSYGPVEGKKDLDVLRLNWRTKYACEDFEDDDGDTGKKAGWGFFTWFILIAFLGIAAYLIFGSWLNYNRYGARGWDLLPHGDTIRDVPYLFKDWSRKVVDTVSGGGSRGGYSAV